VSTDRLTIEEVAKKAGLDQIVLDRTWTLSSIPEPDGYEDGMPWWSGSTTSNWLAGLPDSRRTTTSGGFRLAQHYSTKPSQYHWAAYYDTVDEAMAVADRGWGPELRGRQQIWSNERAWTRTNGRLEWVEARNPALMRSPPADG
jgi:hypothetical protein